MIEKKCYKCGISKPLQDFHKRRDRKYGVGSQCKMCKSESARANYPNVKDKNTAYKKEWLKTHRGSIYRMLSNAKKRAQKKELTYDVDFEFVEQKVLAGVCEVTGWPVSFDAPHKSFSRPSLDRINNAKGYTKANVRLVCWGVNSMLNEYGEDKLIAVANAISRSRYEG